ncbi:MAG: MarR family winged helix-turn-helix transcriptional regulator [Reyranella sp.]|uniref:MarR family winged helix-turn-helix transcriptional regulator n=1 Tax=Reyranella sp. TaxID=1929291 RepID=UPI003D1489DC
MTRRPRTGRSLRNDARHAIASCAGWNARLMARRLNQFFEQRMVEAGLSFAQFGLMAEIASANDDTISVLAERMGLDQSTLSRTLRTLEADGLVEIAIADGDQRRRLVWLTEKGARTLEAALASWRRAHTELSCRLSLDLVRTLAHETEALTRDAGEHARTPVPANA